MTCKDCIGYKFCSRGREGRTNFYGKEVACNNVEELCEDFKNKADFVEVVKVVEILCKIKTNIIKNVSAMIENDFNKIVKDAVEERRDT